jgi:IS5 family transposase
MKPQKVDNHPQLFNSSLAAILNDKHPLYKLANAIDWQRIEKELSVCYAPDMGRPGNATRLMVGLHYLKHTYNESDESLLQRWVENPYWQYFCGYEYMQHECPIHPTSMVKWRKRVGSERMVVLLKETLSTAKREKHIKDSHANKIIVDTTVQEKAIAHPTDARLYCKSIRRLSKLSKQRGIKLRQSYLRVSKQAYFLQSRYARANQYKRAAKYTKKLKTYLGRLIRDIERKAVELDDELLMILSRAKRIHSQKRNDKCKLYSLDAPEVECISKGKAHKRYEFGCKVSLSVTAKGNWITSVSALHGNPFDGHTLNATVLRSEDVTGVKVKEIYVDRGYRGHDYLGDAEVYSQTRKFKKLTQAVKRKLKRRSAIEPTIGHLKSDNRMGRNFLKGVEGDRINALLSAVGYNMRKLIAAFLYALIKFVYFLRNNLLKSVSHLQPTRLPLPN